MSEIKSLFCFVVLVRDQCCIIRSIPAGTDGKSRTGMLTGTSHPHVSPRLKSRTVLACSGRSGLFRPVSLFRPEYFLACFESATQPRGGVSS